MSNRNHKLLVPKESNRSVLQYVYAYNVYTGKFWDGEWYTATRKYAAPITQGFVDSRWKQTEPQRANILLFRAAK